MSESGAVYEPDARLRVRQDLTFVHIGNPDLLADGGINFAKRWQQFNILDNMKRFKKAGSVAAWHLFLCSYRYL